jgi:hypothetical protein
MDLSNIPPGAVFIYHPFRTMWWCVKNGKIPHYQVFLEAVMSMIIFSVSGSFFTHVVQYTGDGKFIHTRRGAVVKNTIDQFWPGYIETAAIVVPQGRMWPLSVSQEFEHKVGFRNFNPHTLPLTTLWRWLYFMSIIKQKYRANAASFNCTAFIATAWLRGGYNILEPGTCFIGLYPSDFMDMSFYRVLKL